MFSESSPLLVSSLHLAIQVSKRAYLPCFVRWETGI